MVDMTLCKNSSCPKNIKCYRFLTKGDPTYQSYTTFKPDTTGECGYFIEIKRGNKNEEKSR